MPRASVAIPVYNTARYLRAAIDSALAQDAAGLEVFVCDNASTDETPRICEAVRDPRFRWRRFEEHVGQPGNWNRCLAEARGEHVVLLHADDLLAPSFVSRASALLDAHPGVQLVHCAVTHIDAEGRPLSVQRLFLGDRVESGDAYFRLLLDGCLINPAGVMVRRSAYASAGPFDEQIAWAVDWEMWLRLALLGGAAYIAEPLACYREHAGSGTASVIASARNGRDELSALAAVFARVPESKPELLALWAAARARAAHRTWCWAEEACRLGQGRATREGLRQAIAMDGALAFKPRTLGLWLASFLGYRTFERLRGWKRATAGP